MRNNMIKLALGVALSLGASDAAWAQSGRTGERRDRKSVV